MRNFFSRLTTVTAAPASPIFKVGDQAERRAEIFLVAHGLQLQARNFRCRHGEIDLIMRDGPMLVFIEVRLRQRSDYGGAAESIHFPKQRRIVLAAQYYLASMQPLPPCRFDAVLLDSLDGKDIEWIRDAFSP